LTKFRKNPVKLMKKRLYLINNRLTSYFVAILVGVLITVGFYQVSPSQASPVLLDEQEIVAQNNPIVNSPSSFVTAAVNRVGQAVVRIDTEKTVTRQIDPFFNDPMFRRFFGDEFFQSIPREQLVRGQGSGFIIDANGIILTNAHVVNQADRVTVSLKDGRTLDGKVMGADPVTDLAVVKVNGSGLPVVKLGNSSQVQVGDWAIAVGNPLGLDNTVTLGIVSTLKRSSAQVGVPDKRLDFIQTDAAINPGNSGGPLLNDRGEVIGINTAIRADAMGIGFAIPIDKAKEIYPRLATGQTVSHPYLGISMITLTPESARNNNTDPNSPIQLPEVEGVLVMQILPNAPAASSGLRRGDVIVEFNGQKVTDARQLQELVEQTNVGDLVKLKIYRGNQSLSLSVRTGELENPS
jgi:S1-C subfamily serine protease